MQHDFVLKWLNFDLLTIRVGGGGGGGWGEVVGKKFGTMMLHFFCDSI